uniref:histidine kinase n=1 Tax=Chromera velia CCMP2878 TaxID=1169474 RepID=A0A0G4HWB4_9ALVE|eukprot:Cvel_9015.t1-p1 / transcript=Cvel_9015.t1 / gene=Cvel_9015 / organism=Chromera_velia_CCMP2878 / gene_product=hypothetical protein / transcript_product=hypothetical protein / location=Cvel_scaffold510:56078-59638(-) / protein_length=990 / sequence_SO=supercontig / SO=protein_coding / is_pseudo=false
MTVLAVAVLTSVVGLSLTGLFGCCELLCLSLWGVFGFLMVLPSFLPKGDNAMLKNNRQKELWSFLWSFGFVMMLHLMATVGTVEEKKPERPEGLQYTLHGIIAFCLKVLLIAVQFSGFHFWVLNVFDSLCWCGGGVLLYGPSILPFMVICFFSWVPCVGLLRLLITHTLLKEMEIAQKALELQKQTEDAKQRFLSYIMHEMRNPLNAAMMSLVEFRATVEELLESSSSGSPRRSLVDPATGAHGGMIAVSAPRTASRGPSANGMRRWSHVGCVTGNTSLLSQSVGPEGCGSDRAKVLRLQRMTEFLGTRFTKMREVCDDVLQLEKLVRGGFAFVFRQGDLSSWIDQQADLAEATVRKGVDFKFEGLKNCLSNRVSVSRGEEEEKGREKEGRQHATSVRAVADYLRLEQVVSNFVSNASKFTVSGKVELEALLRDPTLEEQTELDSVLLQSPLLSVKQKGEGGENERERENPRVTFRFFSFPINVVWSVVRSVSTALSDTAAWLSFPTKKTANPMKQGETGKGQSRPQPHQWVCAVTEMMSNSLNGGGEEGQSVGVAASEHREEAQAGSEKKEKRETENELGDKEKQKAASEHHHFRWGVFEVSVTDTGPGLDKEDIVKLFKPYSQVRAGELQNGGGTGLGLSIAKGFVEAHGGGEIGVESGGRGLGSRFFFKLFVPLSLLSRNSSTADAASGLHSEKGKTKREAGGQEQSESPCRDGGNTKETSTLKEHFESLVGPPSPRRSVREKEIGLPGSPTKGLRSLTPSSISRMHSGLSPCQSDRFTERGTPKDTQEDPPGLGVCLGENSPSASVRRLPSTPLSATPRGSSPESKCVNADVLLVDDDRFCLLAAGAAIRRLGFSVETAEDGDEAVEMIRERGASFRLVLMDNSMPRVKGPAATRMILDFFKDGNKGIRGSGEDPQSRGDAAGSPPGVRDCKQIIPVIVGLTGETSDEIARQFEDAGATKTVHKPLTTAKLTELLSEVRTVNEKYG